MNEAFGNPEGNPQDINWDRMKKQTDNIKDEWDELQTAIAEKDPIKLRDALCDINVFSLGAHHFAGADADADMRAVYESNMSKFCKDAEELAATEAKYLALGVPFYEEGEFPRKCLKAMKDCTDHEGNQYRKGKFLKGIGYKPPVFA